MRKMTNGTTTINVEELIITSNMWEHFITDEETNNDDIKFALVMGFETELGDVYIPELESFMITRTKDLGQCLPAAGWRWKE